MRAFVVLGLVFPYQAKRLAWRTSPKWPILCQVGCKTLTRSINQKVRSLEEYLNETSYLFFGPSGMSPCMMSVNPWPRVSCERLFKED